MRKAYKETTTTVVVPGTAKSVTSKPNGEILVDCEHSIFECFKKTTTTIDHDGVTQIKPGSQVILNIIDVNGEYHYIEGGFISQNEETVPNGILHSFILSEN